MKKNIKERVKSYEDACKVLGEAPITDFGDSTPDEIAYKKLKTIIRALNEGWVADYRDSNQLKWIPWFYVSRYGFVFDASVYDYSYPISGRSSRLCLKSDDLATYAGKQFLNLWEGFLL